MAEQFANGAQTSLSAGVNNVDTAITVVSATGFPTTGNFRILIKAEASYTDEICTVTGVSGATFTITRASEAIRGTQAASTHNSGAEVIHVLTAGGLASNIGSISWEDAVTAVSGKVHRWKFEESSGYPQDSIGSLHMVSGTVSTRQIAGPTGYGMALGSALSPTGYGSLPVGDSARSFVFIWRATSANSSSSNMEILVYGTGSTRLWNHICANHDNYAQTGILFWSEDWKKGNYISDANWHLLVFRYAARAVDINVDGISVAEGSTGAVLNTGTAVTCSLGGSTQEWGDAIVFNRWITNAEIGKLWNSIRGYI